MKKRSLRIFVLAFVIILSLSACGASRNKMETGAYYDEMKRDTSGFRIENSVTESAMEEEPAAATSAVDMTAAMNDHSEAEVRNVSDYEQKLIRTVYLEVETEYFDDTVQEINALCKSVNGYIGSSNLANYSYDRSYSLELRIPVEHLNQFLDHVTNMGKMQIRNKQENTQDITLDYYDSYEHKKSLETERDRILELIKDADSLEYVVQLEDKLSELRYQISSYESSLRRMDDKVNYSTVTLDIREVRQVMVEEDASIGERMLSGLKKNLLDIKDGLGDFSVWFVTNIPQIIIFAIIVFVVIKVVLKRRKKNAKLEEKMEEVKKGKENEEQK